VTDFDPVAQAEANLAVVKLERRLLELKDDGDPDELRDVKHELREARRVFREQRESVLADDDAAVAPDTITTKAAGK